MGLKYSDLIQTWLDMHDQGSPSGFAPIKKHNNSPPVNYLKPEDIAVAMNAKSPYDLYLRPDSSPPWSDYPTSAVNISNKDGVGLPNNILMASGKSGKELLPFKSMVESAAFDYPDIPADYKKFIPQGIYEHEYGHYQDPRLNPNAQGIKSREAPAMRAEDKFWDRIFFNKKR